MVSQSNSVSPSVGESKEEVEEVAVELKTIPSGKDIDEFSNSCSSVVSDKSMESLLVAEYPRARQGFPRTERGVGDCAEDESSSVDLEM
jgi:hypothetical protein